MSSLKDKLAKPSRVAKSLLDPGGHFTSINDDPPLEAEGRDKTIMPDPDGEAVKAAKRRKLAGMKQRGGRDSTILGGEDRLGG